MGVSMVYGRYNMICIYIYIYIHIYIYILATIVFLGCRKPEKERSPESQLQPGIRAPWARTYCWAWPRSSALRGQDWSPRWRIQLMGNRIYVMCWRWGCVGYQFQWWIGFETKHLGVWDMPWSSCSRCFCIAAHLPRRKQKSKHVTWSLARHSPMKVQFSSCTSAQEESDSARSPKTPAAHRVRSPEPKVEWTLRVFIWWFPRMGGYPKSSILVGFPPINHPFWGSPIYGTPPCLVTSNLDPQRIWERTRTGRITDSLCILRISEVPGFISWDCFAQTNEVTTIWYT